MGKLWRWWRNRGSGMDPEIDEEIRLHLEGRVAEYVASGMSRADAEREARQRFGNPGDIAARCRDEQQPMMQRQPRNEIMQTIVQDIRYAIRTLRRNPGFAAGVIVTLVLAIGATTAVFSVVNGVLLHPLPHPDPDQLVLLYEVDQRPGNYNDENFVTVANYSDWREQNHVFQDMAGYQTYLQTFQHDGDPERIESGLVSASFFTILGVNAVLGRTFLPGEDVPGSDDIALLGHEFWVTRFGGDSSVVGQTINVGSSSVQIVGVLPADFRFLDRQSDVWSPLAFQDEMYQNRRSHVMNVVARMRPGVTLDEAQRDMERVVSGLRDAYPEFLTGWGVNVASMTEQVVGHIRPALLVLMGAVAFVLLIASVNVANLMLTRTLGETRETAVRAALGAARGRVVQQKLTECLLLSLIGGSLGTLAAILGTRMLLAIAPSTIPQVRYIGVDGTVLAFALGISIAIGLLFGITPSLQAARLDLSAALREGGRGTTGSRGHQLFRSILAVAQVAFSLVLLVSAGLMIVTFTRLMRVDPGFESSGLTTMKVALPARDYPTAALQSAYWDRLLTRLQTLPGVDKAAVTKFLPLEDQEWTWSVQVIGKPEPAEGERRDYGWHTVSDDYFATMGITVVRGRAFTRTDYRPDASRTMIINQAMARRFFDEGEDPIGRQIYITSRSDEIMEIVGIVEDVRQYSLEEEPLPAYFIPHRMIPFTWFINEMNLAVRTTGNPDALVPTIRREIRDTERQAVITDVVSMRDRVSRSVARTQFAMFVLGAFAAVALALSAVGIYGVLSYAVRQRSQEIGVRIALGAEPARIVGSFLGSGMRIVGLGLVTGLAGATVVARFQASLLYGVAAFDPLTYGVVALTLGSVALAAVLLPAWRASRVDPTRVLRDE